MNDARHRRPRHARPRTRRGARDPLSAPGRRARSWPASCCPRAVRSGGAAAPPPGGRARHPHRVDDGRRAARRPARGPHRDPRRQADRRAPAGAPTSGGPSAVTPCPTSRSTSPSSRSPPVGPERSARCLREQVAWARSVRSVVNAYVVPGSPSSADLAAADRDGSCRGGRSCLLRAAGAADAAHALAGAEASGLDARGWWLDIEDVAARTLWGPTPTPTPRSSSAGATSCVAPARRSGCTPPAATGARSSGTGRPTCRSGPRSAWPASTPLGGPAPARSPAGRCSSPSG